MRLDFGKAAIGARGYSRLFFLNRVRRVWPQSPIDVLASEGQDLVHQPNTPMKTYTSIIHILGLACAGLIAVGAANQAGAAPDSGHLVIDRVANFGTDLGLVVSIDGKDAGTFSEGRKYSGDLPAGEHIIIVRVDPNRGDAQPAKVTLKVEAGQTYSYTAGWSGEDMALTKN